MADITREATMLCREGFRDVRVFGLPWVFVAVAETRLVKSWQLALWLTPRLQVNLSFQTVDA